MNIKHLLTESNLDGYLDTSEKFTFCLDLLDLSLAANGARYCELMVDRLENAFDRMLRAPLTGEKQFISAAEYYSQAFTDSGFGRGEEMD